MDPHSTAADLNPLLAGLERKPDELDHLQHDLARNARAAMGGSMTSDWSGDEDIRVGEAR